MIESSSETPAMGCEVQHRHDGTDGRCMTTEQVEQACEWSDYCKAFGVPERSTEAHEAFLAGWAAARKPGVLDGIMR